MVQNTNKFILLNFAFFFISCYPQQGLNRASQNIEESKKRGVFICEYTVSETPYKINDSIKITVKEAWLEKQWKYSKEPNETSPLNDEYQLNVNVEQNNIEGIDFKWSIGYQQDLSLRQSSKSSLIGDFDKIPTDTLTYPVQKGEAFVGNPINIIGKFVLTKKKY